VSNSEHLGRIIDSGSAFDSPLRDAIRAEQADPGASAETLRRIGEGLERQVAAEARSTAKQSVFRATIHPLSRKSVLLGVGVAALMGIAVATMTYEASSSVTEGEGSVTVPALSQPSEPRSPRLTGDVRSPRTPVEEMPALSANDLPSAPPEPGASAKTGAMRSPPARSTTPASRQVSSPRPIAADAPSETEEIALLAQAHDALSSQPARALALCETLRTQYASGRFTQEREVVEIEALVKLHRTEEARARWNEFKRRYPTSSHRVRLEELFASVGSPAR
jgi:hypothetical protein